MLTEKTNHPIHKVKESIHNASETNRNTDGEIIFCYFWMVFKITLDFSFFFFNWCKNCTCLWDTVWCFDIYIYTLCNVQIRISISYLPIFVILGGWKIPSASSFLWNLKLIIVIYRYCYKIAHLMFWFLTSI